MDDNDGRLALAVRTIVVTTRTAVRTHREVRNPDMASYSAGRGLALLEALESELPADAPQEVKELVEDARATLVAIPIEP